MGKRLIHPPGFDTMLRVLGNPKCLCNGIARRDRFAASGRARCRAPAQITKALNERTVEFAEPYAGISRRGASHPVPMVPGGQVLRDVLA